MNRIAIYLNKMIDGVAYSAPSILEHYSTDRSMLRIHPRVVAVPENTNDVRRLVRFAHQLSQKKVNFPITVRGGGTSKNGSCLGSGLIISTEHLKTIQEIDVRQRLVRVQSGVTLGELKKALNLCGLDLPVVGNPEETIGGLIAKSASASDNTKPSTICAFIDRLEVVLSDGSITEFSNMTPHHAEKHYDAEGFEGELYRKIDTLVIDNSPVVDQMPSKLHERAGYSGLNEVKNRHSFSLIPLFCGSEGTLGVITEVILKVEPVFDEPNYVAIPCRTPSAFVDTCNTLRELKFTDVVFYDTELFNESDALGKTSRFFRKASNDGILIVASAKDDAKRHRRAKFAKLHKELPDSARIIEEDKNNRRDFEELEQTLGAYLNDNATNVFHLPLVDGAYIPPEKQAEFLEGINKISEEQKIKLAVYGSVDFNSFSVRPSFTLNTADGRKKIIAFLGAYLKLIVDCEGRVCGEAPEGRLTAVFAKKYENKELTDLYKQVKEIFDPQNILNPGIKFDTNVKTTLQHFRLDYNDGIIAKD